MNTNTERSSTPLYKVLNEERTQGELKATLLTKSGFYQITKLYNDDDAFMCELIIHEGKEKEAAANAQYTALAVNNLDKLAMALECILEAVQKENTGLNPMWKQYILENCKEALNKIS